MQLAALGANLSKKLQKRILLLLVTIIIGVAIVSGIETSQDSMKQANEFGVIHEAMTIASRAQAWYRRPTLLGGGGRSFANFTLEEVHYDSLSVNGVFRVSEREDWGFRLTGIGKEGDPPLRVTLQVFPNALSPILITR